MQFKWYIIKNKNIITWIWVAVKFCSIFTNNNYYSNTKWLYRFIIYIEMSMVFKHRKQLAISKASANYINVTITKGIRGRVYFMREKFPLFITFGCGV